MIQPTRLFVIGLVVLGFAGSAAADKASTAARAFGDAQAAVLEGDFERAAERFELAYSILPSKEALRGAVRARQQSNQLARAGMLAEQLIALYFSDQPSSKIATDVLAEAKTKYGRVVVQCDAACTISVGGRSLTVAAAPRQVIYMAPGTHAIEVAFGDDLSATRSITATIGNDAQVSVARPPRKAAPPITTGPVATVKAKPKRPGGLPRIVPLVGASLTVVAAGVATWSSFDTRSAHDAYKAMPTEAAFEDGKSKRLRTNLLWGGTAALGVATAVTALFTNWARKPTESRLTVVPSASELVLVFAKPL